MLENMFAELGFHDVLDDNMARAMAQEHFENTLMAGKRRRMWAGLRGKLRRLLDLNEWHTGCNLVQERYGGTQAVALEQIQGSENRTHDFDAEFYPLNHHTETKWVSVALAYLRGVRLPPVELIQVGEVYFVRDGHNRISVAHAFGQVAVDAVVTVWRVGEVC